MFVDNQLVRIHFIIDTILCTGLAPWAFESPFSGSLTSTFLNQVRNLWDFYPLLGPLVQKKCPSETSSPLPAVPRSLNP